MEFMSLIALNFCFTFYVSVEGSAIGCSPLGFSVKETFRIHLLARSIRVKFYWDSTDSLIIRAKVLWNLLSQNLLYSPSCRKGTLGLNFMEFFPVVASKNIFLFVFFFYSIFFFTFISFVVKIFPSFYL